ncbi:hypothetical protein [Nocardia australiensis]|uniref:hypothetical protein n=1 Tax=Nocardia australiensis TaxID=2887191 RepID=UPI001D140E38|nr:hypothetical protein [Nocardia australiensis]
MNYQRRPDAWNGNAVSGSSRSLQAQEIFSLDERPERGRTLITTNHDVIRQWAEKRGAKPATTPGSEYNGVLGVLRFDFPGYGGAVLQPVDWDEWFATFDAQGLKFLYQEQWADGTPSNFNRLEGVDRVLR